jgi:L-ascorbate metabolism protein UlaG (beta-lactamase superfamily)
MTFSRRSALRLGTAGLTGLTLAPAGVINAMAEDMMLEGDMIMAGSSDITVHPVNHASVAISGGGKVIYADPVGDPSMYDGLPKPDLILVTHEHGDHYNAETLAALLGDNTELVTNPAVFDMLPAGLKTKAKSIGNGDNTMGAGFDIAAIPAYNTTADRLQYHPKGRDNGYILTIAGARVYIAGDTEDIPEMRALTGIDIAFVPMNLPYTMAVEQAADGVLAFAPKTVYPYHYRGSDIDQFKSLVDAGGMGIDVRFGDWYA